MSTLPTTAPSASPALTLPTGLFDHVMGYFTPSEWPLISQLTRALREVLYKQLYYRVFFDIHGEDTHVQSFVAEGGVDLPGVHPAMSGMSTVFRSFSVLSPFFVSPRRQVLPDAFTFVAHLCLTTHINRRIHCSHLRPLIMPNLKTLQILPHGSPNDFPELLDFCGSSASSIDGTKPVIHATPRTTCRLLSALRPREVILGGSNTTLTGDGAGLWTGDTFPPPWLSKLVVHIGIYPLVPGRSFLNDLPASLERLTLVFEPHKDEDVWECLYYDGQDEEPELDLGPAVSFLRRLAQITMGKAGLVEIVGAECIDEDPFGVEEDGDDIEEVLRSSIFAACVEKGKSYEEAHEISTAVRLLSWEDWEDRES